MRDIQPPAESTIKELLSDPDGNVSNEQWAVNLKYLSGLSATDLLMVLDDVAKLLVGEESSLYPLVVCWLKVEVGYPTLKPEFVIL